MNPNDHIEKLLKATRYEPGPGAHDRLLNRAYEAMDQTDKSGPDVIRPGVWRIHMKTRNMQIAVAAAVVLVVLGGVTLWPFGPSEKGQWWLGPPAAWGQVITDSLGKVQALVYREGYVFVGDYGYTHVSGNWSRWYKTPDRLRRDKFYDDTLVSTIWEVPQDVGSVLRYDVSFEYECYTVETYESRPTPSDPVEMLLFYVGLLDQADRVLENRTFEGKECVGFEISASKYMDCPDTWIDRIWFDTTTGLPVRMEQHGRPVTDHPEQTFTFVQNEFEYYVDIPAEKFEPQVPEGFANTHPDNIRAARELEEKGEMVFADVPEGLKDRLLAVLDQIDVVAYREGEETQTYLSRRAWRQDHFAGDQVRSTEWYVIEQDDVAPTSLDFNDDSFRLVQTTVDYPNRTYKVVTHTGEGRPQHPMDRIRFLIGYLDRADRILDNEVIDGIECFALELSVKKYGTNPDGMVHRFWFDADTDLPVRIESESILQPSGDKNVQFKDQFTWNPDLPDDFFVPQIPAGSEPAGD